MAYLHLGLALEAAGDRGSAHHAYGAARRALQAGDDAPAGQDIEGYAADELVRLLDAKTLATES
jgi:chemotaxis protein methyltransferase CheR